jgi:hypothetical protein
MAPGSELNDNLAQREAAMPVNITITPELLRLIRDQLRRKCDPGIKHAEPQASQMIIEGEIVGRR